MSSGGTEVREFQPYNAPNITAEEAIRRFQHAEEASHLMQQGKERAALTELRKPLDHFLNEMENHRREVAAAKRRAEKLK